jgi:hypothetical protein
MLFLEYMMQRGFPYKIEDFEKEYQKLVELGVGRSEDEITLQFLCKPIRETDSEEEKTFYLLHISCKEILGPATWTVYSYKNSRKFTSDQLWQYIEHEPNKVVYAIGKIETNGATMGRDILEMLHLNPEVCDGYCSLGNDEQTEDI